jgi:DNA-binding response OmpR family regulator
MPSRVLVVDDDPSTLQLYAGVLRTSGFDVNVASSGRRGLEVAQEIAPHVVLADLRLPDLSAIDILRELRVAGSDAAVVVVTGFGTAKSAVEALRLGACDYVEKPLIGDDLVRVVEVALQSRSTAAAANADESGAPIAHAAARWAAVVVKTIDSPVDPKHFRRWGRCVGASPGTLRRWCRSAGLSPKRSLDFARLLRVVVRSRDRDRQPRPEHLLDAIDARTLRRLLRMGREPAVELGFPQTIDEFLTRQRWITDSNALLEVTRELGPREHPSIAEAC